jgi:hypothetical protein
MSTTRVGLDDAVTKEVTTAPNATRRRRSYESTARRTADVTKVRCTGPWTKT